jgi:phospholipase/lecithinase/hemolysin
MVRHDREMVRQLVVFGDSFSDVGNAPVAPRCNGPLWVEHLAGLLALPPPLPSGRGGRCYAHGGARSGTGIRWPEGIPDLREQVDRHRLRAGAAASAADALHVLRAGANDCKATPWPFGAALGAAINDNLLAAVSSLAEAGAVWFLIPSELPWGRSPAIPAHLPPRERRRLDGLIAAQNDDLRGRLRALAAGRGLRIVQPDFHALLEAILAAPAAFGFRDVRRGAWPDHPDGDGFLWWDGGAHLTTAAHRLFARAARDSLADAL